MSQSAVVASGHQLTTDAAVEALAAGGNAYDAVVAAALTACFCEPVLASLGGGGYLLAVPGNEKKSSAIQYEKPAVFDFFVSTPTHRKRMDDMEFYAFDADFGEAKQCFHIGKGTVATPGMVKGLFEINKALGRIPFAELAQHAIRQGRAGIVVSESQGYIFQVVKPAFMSTREAREIYASKLTQSSGHKLEDEEVVLPGEMLYQRDLADALEVLSIEGEDLFYRGEIAQNLISGLNDEGQLTVDDLKNYQVELRKPISIRFEDALIYSNPLPSSGGTLISLGLQLLQSFVSAGEYRRFGDASHLNALALALEMTQEQRLRVIEDKSTFEQLVAHDQIQQLRDNYRKRLVNNRGTTHISIIDKHRNAASMTLTNGEGSGYIIPGAGIMMNNMLGEADLNPGGFQKWPAGQRLISMMAPTCIDFKDNTRIALGSGGSNRIRSAILQLILNVVGFKMSLNDAVMAPRMHFEEGLLSIENVRMDAEIWQNWDTRRLFRNYPDHQLWNRRNMFFGGTHSVLSSPSMVEAIGDPRRDGKFAKI